MVYAANAAPAYVVEIRKSAADVVFEGIVSAKVPAVIVWLPNVYTPTALFDWVELYKSIALKEVDNVTFV